MRSTTDFLEVVIADASGRVITGTDTAALGRDLGAAEACSAARSGAFLGIPTASADGGYHAVLSALATTNDGLALDVVMVTLDGRPMLGILGAIRSAHESATVRLAARGGTGIIR